jgi:predicted amidophosphoribosyltransferase
MRLFKTICPYCRKKIPLSSLRCPECRGVIPHECGEIERRRLLILAGVVIFLLMIGGIGLVLWLIFG